MAEKIAEDPEVKFIPSTPGGENITAVVSFPKPEDVQVKLEKPENVVGTLGYKRWNDRVPMGLASIVAITAMADGLYRITNQETPILASYASFAEIFTSIITLYSVISHLKGKRIFIILSRMLGIVELNKYH